MRKAKTREIALILLAVMLFSAAAGIVPARAERVTEAEKALEEGGDKALWELVNTSYSNNTYRPEGQAELCIWSPDSPSYPVQYSSDFQQANFYTVMLQETAGVGITLEKLFRYNYGPEGEWTAVRISLPEGGARIAPGGAASFNVIAGADKNSRYEVVVAAGTDDNGHELEFYGVIQLLNFRPQETALVPDSPDYDTDNLRHEADFSIQVSDGVWWVPVSELGKSRYTNREIADMTAHTPEEKQAEISTLYEAVQLLQISGFTFSDDNVDVRENGIPWEHHKPGRDAVRINTGCCSAHANWLRYILDGDYEELGFLAWSWANGNGHVFNYIYRDGWYYFIDLTHYTSDVMTPETGNMAAYRCIERPLGSLHKAKDPQAYIDYYLRSADNDPPARFRMYKGDHVMSLAVIRDEEGNATLYVPEEYEFTEYAGVNPEKLNQVLVKGPEKDYNWSGRKDAKITPKRKYSRSAEDAEEPLTAYKPGDILTLEDNSEKGTATVDGIRYVTCRRDEVSLSFDDSLLLRGRRVNGVFDLRLPLGLHGDAVKDMDSLVLGDLTVGIVKSIPAVQVVICVREGDRLAVREVLDGQYYDSRQVSIRRDEKGGWQESADYWYLIITKDRKAKYEFGRFRCGISDGE